MRVLKSQDIIKEISRIEKRFNIEESSNNNILKYLQDFYNHLNKALGAFEELEVSIELQESIKDNDLKKFIEALSKDIGKLEEGLKSNKIIQQKDRKKFKEVILNIKETYNYFLKEYKESKEVIKKSTKQYIWLMQQATYSLDTHIKSYNKKYNDNLQTIFEIKK